MSQKRAAPKSFFKQLILTTVLMIPFLAWPSLAYESGLVSPSVTQKAKAIVHPVGKALLKLLSATYPNQNGQKIRLADRPQKILILNFWASWCGHCIDEVPVLNAYQKSHPSIDLYGVAVDSADSVKEFLSHTSMRYQTLVTEGDLLGEMRELGNFSGGLPYTLMIDASRNYAVSIIGEVSEAKLNQALSQLEAQKPTISQ